MPIEFQFILTGMEYYQVQREIYIYLELIQYMYDLWYSQVYNLEVGQQITEAFCAIIPPIWIEFLILIATMVNTQANLEESCQI